MDLSIITVTWNSADTIADQIRSVCEGCSGITFEQIVVDNASTDATAHIVATHFPDVRLIANKENVGFGAANNQAVAVAQGRFFLFLNPDMRVQPGSLGSMLEWLKQHPKVGVASCRLFDTHGQDNREAWPRRFPRVRDAVALVLKVHHVFPHILDRYLMSDFDPAKEQRVDSVRGSFLLVRREFIEKLGWAFDPRYYIWFEDVDLCREAYARDYTVTYTPIIFCIDYVGQSFKKRDTMWKQKQFTRSMLVYFQKWEPWWRWAWIAIARPVGIGLSWIREKMNR